MGDLIFPILAAVAGFAGTMYVVRGSSEQNPAARSRGRAKCSKDPIREGEILYKGRRPRTLEEGFSALRAAGCEIDTEPGHEEIEGAIADVWSPKGKSWAGGDTEIHVIDVSNLDDVLALCRRGLWECDPDCPCKWDR